MRKNKKQKLEIGKLGDMEAALKRWKATVIKGPELLRMGNMPLYGGIVFSCMHLFEGRQTVIMAFHKEDTIGAEWPEVLKERILNRHTCLFEASSFDYKIHFQVLFIFNEQQTGIESIVCMDFTIGALYSLDDASKIFGVLMRYIGLDKSKVEKAHQSLLKYFQDIGTPRQ